MRPLVWAFAAVGVVESGLGERLSLVMSQPEGCPPDGCRVGYRFENGGIRPEGWEPYETDNPAVALMDACLTYFMAGTLEGSPTLLVEKREYEVVVRNETSSSPQWIKIYNFPTLSRFGVYRCDVELDYDAGSSAELLAWVNERFGETTDWASDRDRAELHFDQDWDWFLRNEEFQTDVWLRNRARQIPADTPGTVETMASVRFLLSVDYNGPRFEFDGRIPEIDF